MLFDYKCFYLFKMWLKNFILHFYQLINFNNVIFNSCLVHNISNLLKTTKIFFYKENENDIIKRVTCLVT